MFIVDKLAREEIQCIAVAFADDTDLITEGKDAFKLMQETLNICDRLCRAIGRCVQESKTIYFS